MKLIILTILKILASCIEDILIIIGLVILVVTTFTISRVVGMYLLGCLCLIIGVAVARIKPTGAKK